MKTGKSSVEAVENLEIKFLLDSIHFQYGYDFRGYAPASLKRRVHSALLASGCKNISEMTHRVLHDAVFFTNLLNDLTVTVTQLFRDPCMYRRLRQEVLPYLKTYSEIKIWHAGCATGEEVYSLAILLYEENLLDRCLIYGTDINPSALKKAREGIFNVGSLKEATRNYFSAGGKHSLSDYYTAAYDSVMFRESFKKNLVFSDHNLVNDSVFGEMNLVLCRNVLIYFDRLLQTRALKLLTASLGRDGFFVLGSKETLAHTEFRGDFTEFAAEKIYRKCGVAR